MNRPDFSNPASSRYPWLKPLLTGTLCLVGVVLCPQSAHAANLIHYWKLDGDATDSAGAADGTANGGLTYAVGQFGQAVSLDGIDDYISTTAGTILPTTDYTLTAWVFWDGESANGSRGYIAGGQTGGTEGEVFTMSRAADGTDRKLFINLLNNGGQGNSITESADGTISTGTWMHVAYTVDSSAGTRIHVNGTIVGTNPTRTTHDPAANFNIGNNPGTGASNHFDGLIDDVAVFDDVLDVTELTDVMNNSAEGFGNPPQSTTSLIHHWKLDGDATDSAGSADGAENGGLSYTIGQLGQAVSLDGLDDIVTTSAGVIVPVTDYTITAWVFWDDGDDRGRIAGGQLGGGEGEVFALSRSTASQGGTDRKLFLNLLPTGGQGDSITESADNTVTTGVWMHVAYTVDSTAGTKLYLDGTEVAANAVRTTHTPTANFAIGGRADSSQDWFDGLIDDVAIFDGVLTSDQLNNVISAGAENFIEDTTAPMIVSVDPVGDVGAYPGSQLVATFNEDIALTGTGVITITDTDDASGTVVLSLPDVGQVTVSGSELLIDPSANLELGSTFEVMISSDAIEDVAPTPNAFPGTAGGQWTFSTAVEDLTAPVITQMEPDDDAAEVGRGTDIVATFDDKILAGTGNIVIKDLLDGSTTRTISVSDPSQVTVFDNVLTISPSVLLEAERAYTVQIDVGAVINFSELGFAGIVDPDETTWNFTTRSANPNIVFILGDDQAWYDYSFMRRPTVEQAAINMNPSIHQVASTPAIDSLADEGIVFTRGYTPPICRPSLASLVTGAYPHQTLITGNDPASGPDTAIEARMQVLHPLPRTLVDELGYTAFQTGKWWEGHHNNGGFTAGDTVNSTGAGTAPPQWGGGKPGYVTARHGDWGLMTGRVDYVNNIASPAHPITYADTITTATDFIDSQVGGEQPFFLWYAPFLPHTPHDPASGLLAKYDALINEPNESGNFFAKYYANIERFDGGVGALLAHLDSAGIADETIVVLICDNGWINRSNASAYDARSKQTPYEGGIRTPIIVRWPDRIKAGGALEPQLVTTPVSVVDVVPTIHATLDLATHPEMTGLNLLDLDAVQERDTVFTEDSTHDIFDLNDPSQSLEARVAIRDGWKLILSTNGNTELYHLYDTSSGAPVDPFENNDLSAGNPQLVSELTAAIVNWYSVGTKAFSSWIGDPAFVLDPADQGFELDPDGDGLANGVESWFGTHPGEFTAGLADIKLMAGNLTFDHPISPNPPTDLTGFYEWSPDLQVWYAGDGIEGPAGGATVSFASVARNSTATVTATPSQPVERIFVRAGVLQN